MIKQLKINNRNCIIVDGYYITTRDIKCSNTYCCVVLYGKEKILGCLLGSMFCEFRYISIRANPYDVFNEIYSIVIKSYNNCSNKYYIDISNHDYNKFLLFKQKHYVVNVNM